MKNELKIFFTSVMFYTRIPCPSSVDHAPDYINKATRYFPFIGYIVGGISFLFFYASLQLFNLEIALLVSIISGILTTGAFHEDGFADACDGFGGGWTKAKILDIMKDSRVGAYGAIGTVCLLSLKYLALKIALEKSSDIYITILIFILYHSLARFTAISIVFTEQYAKEDEESKAKPIAQTHTYKEILISTLFATIPIITITIVTKNIFFIPIFLPLIVLRFLAIRYFNKWLQGYTGDCLGAVEQVAEIVILLVIATIWKFTL